MEEPSQFSVGQTAQSLTCSIMDKPHTGLDDSENAAGMLKKKDVCFPVRLTSVHKTESDSRLRALCSLLCKGL